MVKDIVFTNTEHVFQEIINMNVKGGSPFGRSAAWAYKLAIEKEDLKTFEDIQQRFISIEETLARLKPTMATIHNTSYLVHSFLSKHTYSDITVLKNGLIELCERIISYSFESVDKLSKYGAALIKDGDTVLMHSYSSSLMGIFVEAVQEGKKFSVICTESRPLRESCEAIRILSEVNVPVTLVSDASVFEIMPKANLALVGADTISWQGDVANKIGTKPIAILASHIMLPVFVASEAYKIDQRTKDGHHIELEIRDKDEFVNNTKFVDFPHVKVINQFFDLTPARFISGIITELGIISPHQISHCWERLESALLI